MPAPMNSGLSPTAPTQHWEQWQWPAALFLASVVFLFALNFYPRTGAPVVVYFGPGITTHDAVVRALTAGAHLRAMGTFANSVIVDSADPNFFRRLHGVGAWLILDARGASRCGLQTPF